MAFSTINKSSLHQNTMLYTGDDGTRNITETGTFQADLVWLKKRNSASSHYLVDAVRGATKAISSDTNSAEATHSSGVTGFVSDGFSLGGQSGYNNTGDTFASWTWKANGAGSANTVGDIDSTVSVNTTSGFSIVKYTGTGSAGDTVGHGLGVAPKMIIIKKLNSATGSDWFVYHASNGNTAKIWLNQTGAVGTGTQMHDTTPTASVFYLGTPTEVNNSGDTFIAYCFAEISGYSKFSSYTGNGNTDGTFVYTGFRPAFVMVKNTSSISYWTTLDNKRNTFNPENKWLYPNINDAEFDASSYPADFLSNGFKIRHVGGYFNTSGDSYIYMAFGQPIISNGGVCATAR